MAPGTTTAAVGVVRTVLIDSHDIFRRGARLTLAEHDRIDVVDDHADFHRGVEAVGDLRPDVVVLGLRAHEQDLIRQLGHLRGRSPGTRSIVMSRRPEDHALALRHGARAALGKDVSGQELARAVTSALEGNDGAAPIDPVAQQHAAASLAHSAALAQLTRQERRILDLIGQGMSNREIATALFLAEKTVRNHVTRLLAKLGVSRRTQAALIAARHLA